MNKKLIALALGAVLCTPAFAQFDWGGGSTTPPKPAWEEFKLNPKTKLKLNFRNANADAIITLLSKTSGITIVKDPSLNFPLTLTSAKEVSLKDAFSILNATLSLKNYEMVKENNLLIIRQKQNRDQGRGGGMGSFDPSMFSAMFPQANLKVYPISYANASQLARVVNEVFQSQQDPLSMLSQMMGGMGGGNRFGGGNQGGRQGGRFGGFSGMSGMMGMGRGGSSVRASSDDFSNSVIVNAPDREQGQVERLIKQLDKQTDDVLKSEVYKLEFASSDDLVTVIQNVLNANAPRGRGGANTQQQQGFGAFLSAVRGQTAGSGTVTSDPRTNSLIISATADNQKIIAKVVKDLDTEVKVENTAMVLTLNNARADQLATLLQQTFGSRTGTNGQNRFGGGTNTQTQRRNTNNNNNNNRLQGPNGSIGNGAVAQNSVDADGKALSLALDDNGADESSLMTQIGVQQGGGFRGLFGQQGGQRNNNAPIGRDANGRLVNIRDLTNQITVIPDINTNSLIIVANPDNADLLRQIVGQLDRIPEQVMIETIIVEASLDSTDRLGVEWTLTSPKTLGQPGTSTGNQNFGLGAASPALDGFRYTLSSKSINAFVNAIQTNTKFNVLSTPKIFTSNNVEAEINISQSVPYVLNSRQDVNGNFTFNYAFLDVGIILNVTPRITSNGYVTMDVSQTANDLQGYTSFNAPIVNQRQASTTVSVKDGETVVLGGIIRQNITSTVKKIPILGDIPLLGNLFKSNSTTKGKTELLVFLTPRVVRSPEEAARLREIEVKKLSPGSQDKVNKEIPPKPKPKPDPDKPTDRDKIPPVKTGGK
jgi:general secretion pathway protein D